MTIQFPRIHHWSNPAYPPTEAPRATFADVWDAIFGRRKRFVRVTYDGSWVICPPQEAIEYIDQENLGDYTVEDVYLTQRQLDALPEFEGF